MRIPKNPPDFWAFVHEKGDDLPALFKKAGTPAVRKFVQKANDGYLHWDKVRRFPMPEGIHPIEMWGAIEMSRTSQFRHVELSIEPDRHFKYWSPPKHQEWLHRIDQDAGGFIGSRSRQVPRDGEDRFLYNSLMEEAIASSQLEGASTTRVIAKQMLRSGRKPKNKHEQMIVNNYNAILELRDAKGEQLTPEFLCHIQQVITESTLNDPTAAGRFRSKEDAEVCVADAVTDDVIYKPPSPFSIDWRIQELCDFANEKSLPFIHPVVKAIILHFAIGFIHPFVDGNGRTARAIFYWYMLKSGYWIFEFLPISRIVLDAPAKYVRAYLYSESDKGDLTYFIHYHLRIIDRAVREMIAYFERQQAFMREAHSLIDSLDLNHRQLSAAYYAIQHPQSVLTFREHASVHSIALGTARNDLFGLEKAGIFERRKQGKSLAFVPVATYRNRLKPGAFRRVNKKDAPPPLAITKQQSEHESEAEPTVDPQMPLAFGET
jgi:Fic family protein